MPIETQEKKSSEIEKIMNKKTKKRNAVKPIDIKDNFDNVINLIEEKEEVLKKEILSEVSFSLEESAKAIGVSSNYLKHICREDKCVMLDGEELTLKLLKSIDDFKPSLIFEYEKDGSNYADGVICVSGSRKFYRLFYHAVKKMMKKLHVNEKKVNAFLEIERLKVDLKQKLLDNFKRTEKP